MNYVKTSTHIVLQMGTDVLILKEAVASIMERKLLAKLLARNARMSLRLSIQLHVRRDSVPKINKQLLIKSVARL